MSNYLYHNKFHQTIHHTVSSPGYPDSATDPIADIDNEFLGTFFNVVSSYRTNYVGYSANSTQWRTNYLHVNSLSADWEQYVTTYATVTALSSNWQKAYAGYTTLNQVSSRYEDMYTAYSANSSYWFNILNALQSNQPQQNTKQKNFAAVTLAASSNIFSWDLNNAQVGFIELTTFIDALDQPSSMKKGGEYILILRQDQGGSKTLGFNSVYKFNTGSPGIIAEPYGVTVIRFVSDGTYMYGKVTQYHYGLGVYITFFSGEGVVLDPEPAGLDAGASFQVGIDGGVSIDGAAPYISGDGINIIENVP